jgi:hypothetical protein
MPEPLRYKTNPTHGGASMTSIHSGNPESRIFNPPEELVKTAAISGLQA